MKETQRPVKQPAKKKRKVQDSDDDEQEVRKYLISLTIWQWLLYVMYCTLFQTMAETIPKQKVVTRGRKPSEAASITTEGIVYDVKKTNPGNKLCKVITFTSFIFYILILQ